MSEQAPDEYAAYVSMVARQPGNCAIVTVASPLFFLLDSSFFAGLRHEKNGYAGSTNEARCRAAFRRDLKSGGLPGSRAAIKNKKPAHGDLLACSRRNGGSPPECGLFKSSVSFRCKNEEERTFFRGETK